MRQTLFMCFVTILFLTVTVSPNAALADKEAAEKTLKTKGLTKKGSYFVLEGETELVKKVAKARRAKSVMTRSLGSLRKEEARLKRIKSYIAQKEFESRKYLKQLAEPNLTAARNNQIVAKLNLIQGEIKEVTEGPLKKQEGEFNEVNGDYIKARDEYIATTLETNTDAETLAKQYAELGKDAEVVGALKTVGEADEKKYLLGPSSVYKSQSAVAKSMAKSIISEDVEIKVENDVPWVEVIINGKQRRSMVLDSGASLVSLPHDVAEGIGLTPSSDTPIIRLSLADGKIVEAWLMEIKSMQLGPFKVENVECAVLPKELIVAEPLLGGTFLKHFVYKLDLANKKLDMARVKGQ